MKKSAALVLVTFFSFIALCFQNCSRVEFDGDGLGSVSGKTLASEGSDDSLVDNVNEPLPTPVPKRGKRRCDDDNSITTIANNSTVLVCAQQIDSITNITNHSKLILVDSSLETLGNSASLNGEVILINSVVKNGGKGTSIRQATDAEAAQYQGECDSLKASAPVVGAQDFSQTTVTQRSIASVPQSSKNLSFTDVQSVSLGPVSAEYASITTIHKSNVKVATKFFSITAVTESSVSLY